MAKLLCLMPTYNKEKTLAHAIESVLMQKTDFDYQLIILDDCSQDSSNKIAKEYQEKYPSKIEIVRNEENLGLLKSIFNGYKLLKGSEYFCVLDADDWYTYDKKFAEAVDFLDKHKNYSMYLTNILLKTSEKESPWYAGNLQIADFDFLDRKFEKAVFIQTSGVVYRNIYFKSGFNKDFENIFNLSFPESYRADGFRFEWYLKAGKAHFVNKIEAVYNYNKEGIWSSLLMAENHLHNARLLYACAEFFEDEKLFYVSLARQLYLQAIDEFNDAPDAVFVKNKALILKLGVLLFQRQKTFVSGLVDFFINLVPNRELRHLLRKQRLI